MWSHIWYKENVARGNLHCSVRRSNWVLHYQSQIPQAHKAGIIPRQCVYGKRWGFAAFLTNPVLVLQAPWTALRSGRLCSHSTALFPSPSQHSDSLMPLCTNARAHLFQDGLRYTSGGADQWKTHLIQKKMKWKHRTKINKCQLYKCIEKCVKKHLHFADAFIQSDLQMRTTEAIKTNKRATHASAITSLS